MRQYFSDRAILIIVAISTFIVSLSLGMLFFNQSVGSDALKAEIIHSKEYSQQLQHQR